ncbi:MAG TPA: hypothetical protein VF538_15555 [Pyrinomonadaceae bacterium]
MITQPHPAFGWLLVILIAALVVAFLAKPGCRPDGVKQATDSEEPPCAPENVKRATGFKAPAFAMEFAETSKGVADLYTACKPACILKGVDGDDSVVIPLYTGLLPFVLALIFLCMPAWVPLPLRVAALALGVCLVGATAFFDSRENRAIRGIVAKTTTGEKLPRERVEDLDLTRELHDLRRATSVKWSLTFAAFAVAGLMVLARGGWWSAAVALACLAVAALGLACLYSNRHALLETIFGLLPLALVLIGLWLALPPRAR